MQKPVMTAYYSTVSMATYIVMFVIRSGVSHYSALCSSCDKRVEQNYALTIRSHLTSFLPPLSSL